VPPPWEELPSDAPRIAANAAQVRRSIAEDAARRAPPTVALAQQWHRDLYEGIARPFDYYAGQVRDCDPDFPDLVGYEVQVAGAPGIPSAQVPQVPRRFELAAQQAASRLDHVIAVGIDPSSMAPAALHAVLTYCAVLHGTWVRRHPFTSGNGRTARLWANWAALRYGLPPFVTIKPRPGQPYGAAAAASMTGDDQVMVAALGQMLRDYLAMKLRDSARPTANTYSRSRR
jgi:fido (protein-threonine AMPylation protein)